MATPEHEQWPSLPHGLSLARTTAEFTDETVPKGLLRRHHIAPGVWGNIVVSRGSLDFAFEDSLGAVRSVAAGDTLAIPPERNHRVLLTGPVTFVIEFYKAD